MSSLEELLPDSDTIETWLSVLRNSGMRTTGSSGHSAFVDFLASALAQEGAHVQRIPYGVKPWIPRRWSMSYEIDGLHHEIPVSAYYPRSGSTTAAGVSGEVAYLGDFRSAVCSPVSLAGKIALVDYAFERDPIGYANIWGLHNPTSASVPTDWNIGVRNWLGLEKLRCAFAAAGAVGMVVAWTNVSEEYAQDQYHPSFSRSGRLARDNAQGGPDSLGEGGELPALWVSQPARALLLDISEQNNPVTLTLEVDQEVSVRTDTLVATLPGRTDEVIILATHTDGVNIIQENGGVALLSLVHGLSQLPESERERGLVVVATTGHFCRGVLDFETGQPTLGESDGFLSLNPDLAVRAVAAISMEHLGSEGWEDDGSRMVATGHHEWVHALTSSSALASCLLDCLEGTDAGPVMVANGRLWGILQPFGAAGVPALSYGSLPIYLNSYADWGEENRFFSVARFREELLVILKMIRRLDSIELFGDGRGA